MRVDSYLVKSGLVRSRSRASELLKAGLIKVDGEVVLKGSYRVEKESVNIEIENSSGANSYVSRAALKLKSLLKKYPLAIKDKIALDIGSSSGGFAQILLEEGAREVICVDVGRDQLDKRLREESRISLFEECDIREFYTNKCIDIVTCDISFISLHYVLDAIDRVCKKGDIILLFKPQFEVGVEAKRDRVGVVLDECAIKKSLDGVKRGARALNWSLKYGDVSEVSGKRGNREYFLCCQK